MNVQSLGTIVAVAVTLIAFISFLLGLKSEISGISEKLEELTAQVGDLGESRWRRTDQIVYSTMLQRSCERYARDLELWLAESGIRNSAEMPQQFPILEIPEPELIGTN